MKEYMLKGGEIARTDAYKAVEDIGKGKLIGFVIGKYLYMSIKPIPYRKADVYMHIKGMAYNDVIEAGDINAGPYYLTVGKFIIFYRK